MAAGEEKIMFPSGGSSTICDQQVISWQNHFQQGTLAQALRSHWKKQVPLICSPLYLPGNQPLEEDETRKSLLFPLELFICGGEPQEVFSQLKNLDNPRQLCGKVFKVGEPTYSCRDCGMDPTCVLCIECFQKSTHKTHRYKMSTSGGGGYCDCGDEEAWRGHPFCDIHQVGAVADEDQDPILVLPEGLRLRTEAVLMCAVPYILQIICWQDLETLPADLEPENKEDTYCCMLYNDEVHTYDQVIKSLNRALDCTQKEAVDFATTVDREGRAAVMNNSQQQCEMVGKVVGRNVGRHTQPLKVHVMHHSIVAHQNFALRVLGWITQLIANSDGFKQLLNRVLTESGIFALSDRTMFGSPELSQLTAVLAMVMKEPSNDANSLSFLDLFFLADTHLWKAARVQCHQLFMGSLLMEQNSKRRFAIIFAKNYPKLIGAFIKDDHDHTMSITSLSVQIFTVPTLARMLIQDYNLLARILAEFLKQCAHYKNMDSKFAFQRNQNYVEFKRAQYMLYDVKYLLTCKPESWPDGLPENFLNGFAVLLDLLSCMQGMDSVTRQVGQHIEYEPEWETAFNLHIKISMFLPLLLEWCATNKQVLVQAYRNALQMLWSIQGRFQVVTRDVDEWAATCINYDPATLPVSIHLPVSRIVAGLHLLLGRFGLTYDSPEFTMEEKPAPRELMEYPLRCQVMVAQSHAGMWRRNGYSLLHQIYLYHSVRCRGEMLDKDIVMLQVSASLLPPNNFLVTLLDRFHLLYWIRDAYDTRQLSSQEETLRQTVALVEEFLRLLIIVLSERFVPGIGKVTAADCLMREIIHQLCIGPMAHSELTKALPENSNEETGVEDVVTRVADFLKPRETVRGTYELKPDCYKHYNPFFYHYTRSDLSKSEETQRKRPKASPSEEGCPPPALVSFTEEFSHLAELLDCEVMLRVMRVVLERTGLTHSRSYSEPQLQMVLHLIGIALHEEARQVEELRGGSLHFVLRATDVGIFARLEVLVANDHAKAHKDLLTWVLKLYKKVKKLKSHAVPELIVTEPSAESVARESERERVDQQRRSDLATARRNRILTQMSQMQKTFISENRQLFDETHTELTPCPSQADIRSDHSMEEEENPVALGAARTAADDNDVGQEMCILCQETTEIRLDGPAMVLAAFVQRSTVMSKSRQKLPEDVEDTDVLFVSSDLFSGTHTATCGHIMHADCWQKFFESVLAKERRRPIRLRHHLSFDIDKNEFLCPLCENLSNTALPLLPSLPSLAASRSQQVELPLADWLDGLEKTVTSSKSVRQNAETAACTSEEELTLLVPESLVAICRLLKENVAANFQQLFNYVCDISSTPSGELCESVVDMIYTFSQSAYTIGLDALPHRENPRMPVMTWNSCAFTIHAIEWYLRDEGKPLFGTFSSRNLDCLNALVRSAAVVSYVCSVEVLKSHCVHLLSSLIGGEHSDEAPCILSTDLFSYLVSAVFLLPALYAENGKQMSIKLVPSGGENERNLLQLIYIAHVVQILLTAETNDEEEMEVEEVISKEDREEGKSLAQLLSFMYKCAGLERDVKITPPRLLQMVRSATLPFLRCAAIFFHFVTNVPAPHDLCLEFPNSEGESICTYLALPSSFTQLVEEPLVNRLVSRWCDHPTARDMMSHRSRRLLDYPLEINQLVHLPSDYSELINQASLFTCPNSDGDDSRAPTMCLVCGTMLCSQSYCCQTELDGVPVGACTAHAACCGAGVGLFLRVRECQVLLLSGRTKGSFFPPPYLDDYGETDQGLRRGNPLHLNPERYRRLQTIWLVHSVPQEIAHALESNSSLLSIDWQHL